MDITTLHAYLRQLRINTSIQRRLNTSQVSAIDTTMELNHLPTKDNRAGILFLSLDQALYATSYEIDMIKASSSGRSKPVICDFCRTWQTGARAGAITFRIGRASLHTISFLCCLDLACSLHVRDKTSASKTSRAQLREQVTTEYRIERLNAKLRLLVDRLLLVPLDSK